MSAAYLRDWARSRGPYYIGKRLYAILGRYGLSTARSIERIEACVKAWARMGCRPTFPTPGLVVKRRPGFFRRLQDEGVEIAVHGFHHKDLRAVPLSEAVEQLVRAVRVFEANGIRIHGFRCPYLGFTEALLEGIPEGLFEYSSNRAILWEASSPVDGKGEKRIVETLRGLYDPWPAANFVSVPWSRPKALEIPVSLPDDLTLADGYAYDPQGMAEAWSGVLDGIHERGELFNLIFHPELVDRCGPAFVDVIGRAKRKAPPVWIASLGEISTWWREKAGFRADAALSPTGMRLVFTCTDRATILAKGCPPVGATAVWDGGYRRIRTRILDVPAFPRPFLGITPGTSQGTIRFLREQGYILDESTLARSCGIFLDEARLASLPSQTRLIEFIESQSGPLVRFGRWPDGAKGAMSLSGDLDALSLADYIMRLFAS